MTSSLHRLLDQRGLLTRRETLVLSAGAVAAMVAPPAMTQPAVAQEETERHGISTFGDLKHPADFKHFDYVNPNAPKGGIFSQTADGGVQPELPHQFAQYLHPHG
jgi:ABC-type oligopeptide transport system substrate-binding subunit